MKKIKLEEQFQLGDQVYLYTKNDEGKPIIKSVASSNVKKEKEKKAFVPPTLADVIVFFNKNGYDNELAKKFFNGYDVAEWKDSNGRQIHNWQQKAHQVWFRDTNKLPVKEKQESKFMF